MPWHLGSHFVVVKVNNKPNKKIKNGNEIPTIMKKIQ